jgi:hypothetical protein
LAYFSEEERKQEFVEAWISTPERTQSSMMFLLTSQSQVPDLRLLVFQLIKAVVSAPEYHNSESRDRL